MRYKDIVDDCYEIIDKALVGQIRGIFQSAWTTTLKNEKGGRLIVPFVGSGLNNIAKGGFLDWKTLVNHIEAIVGQELKDHEIDDAGLSYPERLEIILGKNNVKDKKETLISAFSGFNQVTPSEFHLRLVESFPVIITTNYNRIFESVTLHPKEYDATNPESGQPADPYLASSHSVLHIHGVFPEDGNAEEIFSRLIRGVGRAAMAGVSEVGPCLILTEGQYHRLYNFDRHFDRVVRRTFSDDNLLLFIGSGLTKDEIGIHAYLRDLQYSRGHRFVGIYVGISPSLNKAKISLLESRGLICIQLPMKYGQKAQSQENVWHAFLDACHALFSADRIDKTAPQRDVINPEIVCIGLSSRQTVLGIEKHLREEAANKILFREEEPSGQHLLPAFELAKRGRNVALVTRIGDDSDGNWLKNQILKTSQDLCGNIDTQGIFEQTGLITPRAYVATYPFINDKKPEGKKRLALGKRTIFDFWTKASDWSPKPDAIVINALKKVLLRYKDNDVSIYFGPLGLWLSEIALDTLNPKYSFVDTSTRGPGTEGIDNKYEEFMGLLKRSTHVLASAKFLYRVKFKNKTYRTYNERESGSWYQEEITKNEMYKSILKEVYQIIFPETPRKDKYLVLTMGDEGCAYIEDTMNVVHVEGKEVFETDAKAWIGCGDLFRAGFIDEWLKAENILASCQKGNEAGAERIRRERSFQKS